MRRLPGLFIPLMLIFSSVLQAAEEGKLGEGMVNPGYHEKPDWFKASFLDIREDIDEAKAGGKRILLYMYQDGCPYCAKLLQDNWGQRRLAEKTQKHFDVVAVNMWGDREVVSLDGQTMTEKNFALKRKVMFTPTLLFLDEKGDVALRVNGYYAPAKFEAALDYVAGHNEKKISFLDYYAKKSPVPVAGKLHAQPFILKQPYALDQLIKKDKPLLVLFEQKKCRDCDELHNDILKRKETVDEISKFNVVRMDIWGKDKIIAPSGKQMTMKDFARQLNVMHVPSMVFFDGGVKDVYRTEAYLKAFHTQSVMDFVSSGEYKTEPSMQRFIQRRAEKLEAKGIHVDLMK
ncbi:MAG: thioredoxin fold domain-containing protein [Gammaproteobacteria bacterium]